MHIEDFYQVMSGGKYLLFIEEKRKLRRENGVGIEKHHIYPRSFEDGKIDGDNCINLTISEHWEAHILLVLDLEQYYSVHSRSYQKAVYALDWMLQTRWKDLSEDEKRNKLENIRQGFYTDISEHLYKIRSDNSKKASRT